MIERNYRPTTGELAFCLAVWTACVSVFVGGWALILTWGNYTFAADMAILAGLVAATVIMWVGK